MSCYADKASPSSKALKLDTRSVGLGIIDQFIHNSRHYFILSFMLIQGK